MSFQRSYDPGIWTYDDYLRLDDGVRYEVLGGTLRMAPAPGLHHQRIAGGLYMALRTHIEQHALGEVFFAPIDVRLSDTDVVQPDVVFVAAGRDEILHPRGIMGPPDLVVEIISPSSARLDRHDKRELYGRFGVREYWIVDPASRSVEVCVLENGIYTFISPVSADEEIRSAVVKGFRMKPGAILPPIITSPHGLRMG